MRLIASGTIKFRILYTHRDKFAIPRIRRRIREPKWKGDKHQCTCTPNAQLSDPYWVIGIKNRIAKPNRQQQRFIYNPVPSDLSM